jgi:hypothetical protein
MARWEIEYAPKFTVKSQNLKSPLASQRLERLCEWIAEQKDPDQIPHCKSCAEEVNKKLYFPTYGWHIVFRFEDGTVVFVMFYNAPDGMKKL